jgi:serine/threonine protein kinase
MAEVWEGQDEVLGRPVAVKVLLTHLAADPYLRERFRREAVTAAQLVHPGIVAVFDAGVEPLRGDGLLPSKRALPSGAGPALGRPWPEPTWSEGASTAFIVMELVTGPTLRDLMAEQALTAAPLCVAVAHQVSEALAYAHSQGLVHRDVKPANVLLREEGPSLYRVKVTDFGIAKAAAATRDLTASGTLLGTPKYISPEQVQGREPDGRADLYSLGVVMYEMLAGRAPFREGSDVATALAHVQKPAPSLADARPELPADLIRLVSRLLAKDPSERPQSASLLSRELAEIASRIGSPMEAGYMRLERQKSELGQTLPAKSAPAATPGPTTASRAATPGPTTASRAATPGPSASRGRRRRRARAKMGYGGWVSAVVTTLIVASLAVASALFFGGGLVGGGASRGSRGQVGRAGTFRIVSISELAIDGNKPNDNVGMLPNLTSTDPSAHWESAKYLGPRFGGFGGLGLMLQLSRQHKVHQLTVLTPMEHWSAETFVSDHAFPALSGWGQPTDKRSGLNGNATFSLGDRTGSWVLFWMLDPGPTDQAVVDKLYIN